jgi:hypothetical protein
MYDCTKALMIIPLPTQILIWFVTIYEQHKLKTVITKLYFRFQPARHPAVRQRLCCLSQVPRHHWDAAGFEPLQQLN